MIRSGLETSFTNTLTSETSREVDPFTDPESVRLVAINLELAVRNLMNSSISTECLVLTADICSHRLIAMPDGNGDVSVFVLET